MTTTKDVLAELITADDPEKFERLANVISEILGEKYGKDRGRRLLKIVIVQLLDRLD